MFILLYQRLPQSYKQYGSPSSFPKQGSFGKPRQGSAGALAFMTIFTVILPLLYAVAFPVAIWCAMACRCASSVGGYVMFVMPMD